MPDSRKVVFFIAKVTRPDLELLCALIESGKVRPVVERVYSLGKAGDALSHLGEGHAHGKIVVTVP